MQEVAYHNSFQQMYQDTCQPFFDNKFLGQHLLYQKTSYLKSPLNYIGGKYKLLGQLIHFFPKNIHNFVDLFAGGCNVAINTQAKTIFCNDNIIYLIDLYKTLQNNQISNILEHINIQIDKYKLSLTNAEGFNELRKTYNSKRNPLDLFVLLAYSFNHQIRFNSKHEYNNPFGKERSSFNQNMKQNLINFIKKIQTDSFVFTANNFDNFDINILSSNDFVYCDPPYLITNGTYNDGKRGFTGWSEQEEYSLLNLLNTLDSKNIKFALSNVLEHKGKSNNILKDWVKKHQYNINFLTADYSNANYQISKNNGKNNTKSVEVLITNYQLEF